MKPAENHASKMRREMHIHYFICKSFIIIHENVTASRISKRVNIFPNACCAAREIKCFFLASIIIAAKIKFVINRQHERIETN